MEHGISPVAYASSAAIFGPPELYPEPMLGPDALPKPATLYGAYKVANEQTAAVFAADHGLASGGAEAVHRVWSRPRPGGSRPSPARPSTSAARGEPYRVGLRWRDRLPLRPRRGPDCFIAAARVELDPPAAPVRNLRGHVTSVADFGGQGSSHHRLRRPRRRHRAAALPPRGVAGGTGLAELLGDVRAHAAGRCHRRDGPHPVRGAIAAAARATAARELAAFCTECVRSAASSRGTRCRRARERGTLLR